MKLLITMKYLTFPVNTKTVSKKVCLYEGDDLLFDFECKIDMISPDFTAYIDVSRFKGKTVDIAVSPQIKFEVGVSNSMNLPNLYSEPLRPQVHFTVRNGWNNDPNGLIKYNGTYHMFYQYNPCSNEWANMHWGHAESVDLIHWKHKDVALFPDEMGVMYSGSAIEDKENAAGFGKGAFLLYYTAAARRNLLSEGKETTQCLAYSTDGGKSFVKYGKNPIVDNLERSNRDPKVVYVEELRKYLMIIFLADSRYRMLVSNDLVNFDFFQDVTIRGDNECPDIYPLYHKGKKFWIVSGALDVYIVGYFTKDRFVMVNEEKKLTYSPTSYAAQSFSGVDDGRTVRIAWDKLKIPCPRFSQQMGFPNEVRLEEVQGKYYLAASPVKEIETLFDGGEILERFDPKPEIIFKVGENPLYLNLKSNFETGRKIFLSLFGNQLVIDTSLNQIIFKDIKMPISILRDRIEIKIIVDRCSLEVFADNGKMCFTAPMICDYNLPNLILSSDSATEIEYFEYKILKSIYK